MESQGRKEHTLGSPLIYIFAGLIASLCNATPPPRPDAPMRCRPKKDEVSLWLRACRTAQCFDRPGAPKMKEVIFAVNGIVPVNLSERALVASETERKAAMCEDTSEVMYMMNEEEEVIDPHAIVLPTASPGSIKASFQIGTKP